MSFFRNQFANVVEWQEFRDDMIFYKWSNREIKKGSRLIIRPGQDAVFFNNGKIEGVFRDEGEYDIESQIIPFLSTLKGFKFGFNSGMRVEVLFVNTKEFIEKWGTKNAINIPTLGLPGGMPIRANGTFNFKVNDYVALIDQIAGVREQYVVEDVKIRITSILDQLLMKWISREGKDMFNLQSNTFEISKGIQEDLDMQLIKSGITITGFNVMSFSYPKEIQDMITKNASHGMVGNVDRYQQISITDGMASGKMSGGGAASDMAGMMMGMNIAGKMLNQMNQQADNQPAPSQNPQPPAQQNAGNQKRPNFCPNCGTKTGEGNFCSNCGHKLV
ncbi:SPFH domain-containing protein [Bacillus sp. DTU_2020_1000418_1_SI_GHA_SEK_038]|uniref:SPFH domain-containing protein n=1 Tax=Bacillus sp. DTU_2020_1000418_1_SI_GHA_SEK_038 TaxID=3077585 RepID=UPI0028E7648E|nr:SPFH domain-containing protein [Bacillus sp. DTU_2020_1000418_1_SI_GHA_SEK_038]WNS75408.1 SPFH domain-containing protein [Bacillus sp. DTU_2020_1000418_1_SI_GHA_SEK_038]